MIIHVESCADHHGDLEPVAFHLGGKHSGVLHIVDRWLSEDCSYFKVNVEDDASICILRYDHATQEWQLTLYQAPQIHSR